MLTWLDYVVALACILLIAALGWMAGWMGVLAGVAAFFIGFLERRIRG